eukprot:1369247-Amphidinium_carterae.1
MTSQPVGTFTKTACALLSVQMCFGSHVVNWICMWQCEKAHKMRTPIVSSATSRAQQESFPLVMLGRVDATGHMLASPAPRQCVVHFCTGALPRDREQLLSRAS